MIRTLSKSIRQYRLPSVLSPVFVTGEVLLECFIPLVMADLIDEMTGTSMTPILHYGLILIILAMLSLLCGVLSGYYAASAACGFAKNLRMDEYFKIQALSFSDIDRFSTSSLVTRLTTDITNVQNAYQMLIRVAIRGPLMLVISIIMSVSINPRMSLIFLAIIPVLASALFLISAKVMPIFRRIFKKYDAMNASIQENVAGIRVVKAFVREEYEKKKFSATSGDVCADFTMAEKILALNNPVMTFCIYLALLLVSAIGARIIITSGGAALTTGDLSSLINYGTQILTSLMMLSMVFVMVSMAVESGRRIEEVLTTESSIKSPENGIMEVKDGSVEFRGVSFRYQEKAKRNVLGDISLKIASGETIGIIGGTGSSKSSLVQLIPRLYDVNEGEVLVGGVNVRDYNLEALRNAVAVVLQKNTLFSGTIRENLLWGNENASEEEILEASRLAQADEFVQQFPHKYDTYVSQGGTSVSGGQKQRLCIARALLKKPKILILDDSTSAVDTRTDALIRMAFREKIPFTTRIIIAQRVSSVEDADRILVMEDGKIAEMGTHEELLALGGIYRSIYDSQSRTEKEEAS